MTGIPRGSSKVLTERDCNIQDHLRNHAHLTNCIHLKNHIHMQKPRAMLDKRRLVETSLMKDLIVLQRSRSLRDPSTSPSWNSPIIGSLIKRLEKEATVKQNDFGGVKSWIGESGKEPRRALSLSPLSQSGMSRKIAGIVGGINAKDSIEENMRQRRRSKAIGYPHTDSRLRRRNLRRNEGRKGLSDENWRSDSEIGRLAKVKDLKRTERPLRDGCCPQQGMETNKDIEKQSQRDILREGVDNKDIVSKKLTGRLKNNAAKGPEVQSSYSHQTHSHVGKGMINDEKAQSHSIVNDREQLASCSDLHVRSHLSARELSRPKKHKLKGNGKSHFHGFRGGGEHSGAPSVSVPSHAMGFGMNVIKHMPDSRRTVLQMGHGGPKVTKFPKKGCGIPWNWSRIHDRGKSILDLAGRSLSCGLSDSTVRKIEGLASQSHSSSGRDFSAVLGTSDHSTFSLDSDSESLPLLIEPGESQESVDTDALGGKFSGELDLYVDHKIGARQINELASETKSTDHFAFGQDIKGSGCLRHEGRNRSLSQKYVPKTFRELVGQNLVIQALMNAILREKIAPVYLFHGPHGTGKTSCARIFAAAMNCHSLEKSRPCGLCHSCLAQSLGKYSDVKEIGRAGSLGFDNFQSVLDNVVLFSPSSRYRVFIVDDCDTLTSDDWNTFSKILDEVPWHVVFILITSSLDRLPHTILARGQKYLFPKLKETDIVNKLQVIALQEDLEIDHDALMLIASRSNGSMRDAEMTLDQLSLLGQRISLPVVQELVGLIPDEKLVDLLDLALSADTVNTVKSLRELMEAGVEPLALMSQLATLITDILAGSYKLHKERHKRMFFHKQTLSKEEMNRLRQALRTLSEAEKQLLLSNDRTTWLTAAMLQLAPDQSYTFPSSSAGTSVAQSPALNARSEKEKIDPEAMGAIRSNLDKNSEPVQVMKGSPVLEAGASGIRESISTRTVRGSNSTNRVGSRSKSPSLNFLQGKKNLPPVGDNMDSKMTDQLKFHNQEHKTRAEDFSSSTSQSSLGCPVGVQINSVPSEGRRNDLQVRAILPSDQSNTSNAIQNRAYDSMEHRVRPGYAGTDTEISVISGVRYGTRVDEHGAFQSPVEACSGVGPELVGSSLHGYSGSQHADVGAHLDEELLESAWVQEVQSSPHIAMFGPYHPERPRDTVQPTSESIVKSKVPYGSVIRQSDSSISGFSQHNYTDGSSNQEGGGHLGGDLLFREGITIAEKIEEENLRLESRSGRLLCWKAPKVDSGKSSHFRSRTRRSRLFLVLVPCAKSSR
eukprot:Gb_17581 [translate_table: standard]